MSASAPAARADTPQTTATFDCYGLRFAVRGDWPEALETIRLSFAWFEVPSSPGEVAELEVAIEHGPPDFDRFGNLEAAFVTPRNVVYQDGRRTVVDYFGRAVSVLDRAARRLEVRGEDAALVSEAGYLFLLAAVGEHLDKRGLTRLHALGLSTASGATAIMLPSGGGKSTLALRALRDDSVRLLSEDSPLVDRRGRVHPFPLRLGINATDAERLPAEHVRRLERMEFHPKLVLELEAFSERIEARPRRLRHLVVGRRTLGLEARLEPLPRRTAVGPLLREAVFGVGIYQGMEFVLQRGLVDTIGMGGTAFTRMGCCAAGLAQAKVWRLTMGRDHERNWDALAPVLG